MSGLTENIQKTESVRETIQRELVVAFYTAKLFLPGFFNNIFFVILGILIPFFDYGTDYYNAGKNYYFEK